MEILFKCSDHASVVQLRQPTEIIKLVNLLERIANELLWQPGTQMRDYQGDAVHFGALVGDKIVGGMQVVQSGFECPLPYCRVWPELHTPDRLDIAHVTILAFQKEYRGKYGLFWPLCVEFWSWCVAQGLTEIRIEVTPATLRLYHRIGWPLEIIGDLRPHWGEKCYLARMSVSDVANVIQEKAKTSTVYDNLIRQAFPDVSSTANIESAIDLTTVL